ncbi:MAG: glycoside hydrolase family 57 protein [Candidatus Gastranaerophilaceae bacterium]|jgi:alpha-amylase/alpha-mannosidase (GH57 family)
MDKKLSIAFVWHMHQPSYKDETTGDYIMPWVRLHAIKDYLDMLLILDEFPNIKQTFNLVPLLLEQIEDYADNNAHDIHSKYTICDISDLTIENKNYILDYFFDANYSNMIEPNEQYKLLYEKRFTKNFAASDFSDQEYSDLMAWFNLVWFDPYWVEKNSELKALIDKGKNYTLQDRIRIIEMQRDIIKQIIPLYKKRWEENKIEISTSPYYHPILPLLINFESALVAKPNIQLPQSVSQSKEDTKEQIFKSFEKFQKIFGKKPAGIWPSEQCISPEVMDLFAEMDVKWTIADEGILSKTLNKEFVRNFRGINEDPFDLCKAYCYRKENREVNIVFRDSVLANLLNFEYGNHEPKEAANDFYERIKTIQSKLNSSPDENHIVTIALDGENCWESYPKDGRDFLLELYSMISEDKSLETVTINEYLTNAGCQKTLNTIYSGSWINKNFQLWIGEPTKNLAWDYLNKTRMDFKEFISLEKYDDASIQKAKEEIYISQGSDWFWWYGEPNDSGQDDLFDLLFRSHLQNVYKILKKPVPPHLNIPLESFIGKPSKIPKGLIMPKINGVIDSIAEWDNAGCIELHRSPTYMLDKLFDKIFFGNDENNIYFRIDMNKFYLFNVKSDIYSNEICIYFNNPSSKHFSPVRIRNKGENIPQILRYTYSHELQIPICQGQILSPILSEAMDNSLWKVNLGHDINYNFADVLEISIPFKDIKLEQNQKIYFIIAICKINILNEVLPLDQAIYIERPSQLSLLNL